MNRRDFIVLGSTGFAGASLMDVMASKHPWSVSKEGKAKNVINIYLPGGMAHQESWDPKYLAAQEYRGPLGTVKTNTGERFSENLKYTAKVADKITVIRSMTHGEAAHERGTHNMMTGWRPSPAITYPSMGSVVSKEFGSRKDLPPYVAIPRPSRSSGAGYLNFKYGPFGLGSNPESPNFSVRDLSLPSGVTAERFAGRKKMRSIIDNRFSKFEKNEQLDAMDSFYLKAYDLVSSPQARAAFEIDKEPVDMREAYGMNSAGQRFLMARRLVEAGVRFVTLTYGGFDHHSNIKDNMNRQLEPFDKAYATLITDLHERGMLDDTLVLVTTEFGRTPKINSNAGRDHWPQVFSIAMAGGGVKGGYIHGTSDPTGSTPEDDPFTVDNYAATVFSLIGIDPRKELMADGGRPIRVVNNNVIEPRILK
tara:strand:+ start:44036 stop:45301 length:1266 start_codon:yes stop_codon:yes gene_type:complete